MRIYRVAQEKCPQEYGYNITTDKRVAPVNWDEPDVQINDVWSEETVKEFLQLPDDAVIYQTLADANDLSPSLAEEDEVGSGYDWSELQNRRSNPPPALITRTVKDVILIHDGNHRIRFFQDRGFEYIPTWCYDEKITEWIRQNPNYVHQSDDQLEEDEEEEGDLT